MIDQSQYRIAAISAPAKKDSLQVISDHDVPKDATTFSFQNHTHILSISVGDHDLIKCPVCHKK